MHNVSSQSLPIFPLYILLAKRTGMFEWKGINLFWSRGIGTVWHRKSESKKRNINKDFLNYTNFFVKTFQGQTIPKSYLSFPTSNLFIFDLVYTTRTDPILRLNLNNKKLLKCANNTNFLCINLDYKKNVPIPSPYLLLTYSKIIFTNFYQLFITYKKPLPTS